MVEGRIGSLWVACALTCACVGNVDEGRSALSGAEQARCEVDVTGWELTSGELSARLGGVVATRDYLVVEVDGRGPWTLWDSEGTVLDGPTVVAEGAMHRRGNSPAHRAQSWHRGGGPSPGSGRLSGPHIRLSELGEGFVEIYTGGFTDGCDETDPSETDPSETDPPVGRSTCASDADCTDHPDGPTCHPFGNFCGVDISNWGVLQFNAARSRYFATPTVVRSGTTIVLSPSGDRGAFESWWGVTLGPDAVFVSTGTFPAIDGGETYVVQAPGFVTADGPTAPATRGIVVDPDGRPVPSTPGSSSCDPGVSITEIGDVPGSDLHPFEYLELCVRH